MKVTELSKAGQWCWAVRLGAPRPEAASRFPPPRRGHEPRLCCWKEGNGCVVCARAAEQTRVGGNGRIPGPKGEMQAKASRCFSLGRGACNARSQP